MVMMMKTLSSIKATALLFSDLKAICNTHGNNIEPTSRLILHATFSQKEQSEIMRLQKEMFSGFQKSIRCRKRFFTYIIMVQLTAGTPNKPWKSTLKQVPLSSGQRTPNMVVPYQLLKS
jgi:hypothetical protein